MEVSEMIAILQAFERTHGDLKVCNSDIAFFEEIRVEVIDDADGEQAIIMYHEQEEHD